MEDEDEATTFTHLNIQSIADKYKIYENDQLTTEIDVDLVSDDSASTVDIRPTKRNESDINVDSFLESLARKYDIDLSSTDDKTAVPTKKARFSYANEVKTTFERLASSDEDEVELRTVSRSSEAELPTVRRSLSISSDDEEMVVPTLKYVIRNDDDDEDETELPTVHRSLSISSDEETVLPTSPKLVTRNDLISDDDETETELPTLQTNLPSTSYKVPTCSTNTSSDEEVSSTQRKKAGVSNEKKERAKIERERKKEEAQRQKEIKKLMQATNKSLKPDECIKFVTALIDPSIIYNFSENEVAEAIKTLGTNYKVERQLIPNSITWSRKTDTHYLDDEGKFRAKTKTEECDQLLLIYTTKDFLKLVSDDVLVPQVRDMENVVSGKRISLGVYGMQSYFRGKRKGEKLPKISRHVIEDALTELQIYSNVCYRFIDKIEDVAALIAQFTKSVAQKPYKLDKQEKYKEAEWYMSGDNKDCVKVDKDGNGLKRLWQQHLTMFPMARIETAEAIMAIYPTITSLIKAYDDCATEAERETLLQEIQIRRAAGPFSNNRKIGPELSKKIYTVYNSLDGNTYI